MILINDLNELDGPLKKPVLTIGNFDGVHKGHIALFNKVKERAKFLEGQSALMTFEPHPVKVMKPEKAPLLITPTQQKIQLISDTGLDVIFCVPFTKEFASITARDFIKKVLLGKIGVKEIVVGYDYTFGHDREGNINLLKEMGSQHGFPVHVVEPVEIGETPVSSTSIRQLLQEGNLELAKKLLGRDYQIRGTVVSGKNRGGRLLGFPTANLDPLDELTPKPGVYAVKVLIDGQIYDGVTNVGYNPTFGKGPFTVETHILDFSEDLLKKTIKVNFIHRLRDEKTFDSIEDLSDQINQDVLNAREIFKKIKNS